MAIIGARTLIFREFRACGAPTFHGERDPIVSRMWLAYMAKTFRTNFFPEEAKVRYFSFQLMDRARDWWEEIGSKLGDDAVDAMSWDDILTRFRAEFAPEIEVHQLAQEFLDLHQTTETVAETTAKFRERTLLVPQYVADEDIKKVRYPDMLWDDIRKFMSISGCETLNDMISRARERKIDLEHTEKRSDQVHTMEGMGKRPKTSDQHSRGHQDQSQCNMYGKLQDGACRSRGLGCYKCGQVGHISKDCPQGASPLCFHCDRVGHKKADCLTLRGGIVSVSALASFRITDG
ncbi:uncharacterized protein LOC128127284 [Lactuca sativa]|uniref:uncharacterized protein LOC128127284 n=1 Tax=Lactuca sativa TaxID=4236 RepID=UPI0022AF3699|nr:uncharacterized protein LOC128127284 [Lactuca sativa]